MPKPKYIRVLTNGQVVDVLPSINKVISKYKVGMRRLIKAIDNKKEIRGYIFEYIPEGEENINLAPNNKDSNKDSMTSIDNQPVKTLNIIRYSQAKRIYARGILAGDFHCGHYAGLTMPQYQISENEDTERFHHLQRQTWNWFANIIEANKPFDFGIFNGDLIDGKQGKQEGVELFVTDMNMQCNMAAAVIKFVRPSETFITKGTPYHTGKGEDFENAIAIKTGATISGNIDLDINGVIINARHKVGGSGIENGRATPLLRERIVERLWAEMDERPKIDLLIRSHVHYYLQTTDVRGTCLILPALQAAMSRYGRQVTNCVDYGFCIVDIYEDRTFEVKTYTLIPEAQKRKLIKL